MLYEVITQKVSLGLGIGGLFILILALFNINFPNLGWFLTFAMVLISIGTLVFSNDAYLNKSKGIKNDGVWFKSISSRGLLGWSLGIIITLFYIVLYFYPQYLGLAKAGEPNSGLIALFDPLSYLLT